MECLRRKPSRELVDQDVQPARYGMGEGWVQAFTLLTGSKEAEVRGACGHPLWQGEMGFRPPVGGLRSQAFLQWRCSDRAGEHRVP